MKKLFVALSAVALLVGAQTTWAMLPGVSEIGRHIPSVPVLGTQDQFKGDIVTPQNGPMLAPFVPWHGRNGFMLAPFVPWHGRNSFMLAPFVPWHPSLC